MDLVSHNRLGQVLSRRAGFPSKSGGRLHVMLQLGPKDFTRFLGQNKTLRIYRVFDIPKGGVGAREFHRYRSEIITVEKGSFRLLLENLWGNKKSVILRERMTYGIIRPFVLHTYMALSSQASLHVVANTLYDRKKPSTHDSYPEKEFRRLRASLLSKAVKGKGVSVVETRT